MSLKKKINKIFSKYLLPMHPIVFISTISDENIDNIAPFATCVDIGYEPPIISFASNKVKHKNISKDILFFEPQDTYTNIYQTQRFTINIPGLNLIRKLNAIAEPTDPEIDEFEISGLTKLNSTYFKDPENSPKLILECLAHLECELLEIIDIEKCDHYLIIGEVKNVMVNSDLGEDIKEIRDNLIPQVFGNLRANSSTTRLIGKIVPIEVECPVYSSDLEIVKLIKS